MDAFDLAILPSIFHNDPRCVEQLRLVHRFQQLLNEASCEADVEEGKSILEKFRTDELFRPASQSAVSSVKSKAGRKRAVRETPSTVVSQQDEPRKSPSSPQAKKSRTTRKRAEKESIAPKSEADGTSPENLDVPTEVVEQPPVRQTRASKQSASVRQTKASKRTASVRQTAKASKARKNASADVPDDSSDDSGTVPEPVKPAEIEIPETIEPKEDSAPLMEPETVRRVGRSKKVSSTPAQDEPVEEELPVEAAPALDSATKPSSNNSSVQFIEPTPIEDVEEIVVSDVESPKDEVITVEGSPKVEAKAKISQSSSEDQVEAMEVSTTDDDRLSDLAPLKSKSVDSGISQNFVSDQSQALDDELPSAGESNRKLSKLVEEQASVAAISTPQQANTRLSRRDQFSTQGSVASTLTSRRSSSLAPCSTIKRICSTKIPLFISRTKSQSPSNRAAYAASALNSLRAFPNVSTQSSLVRRNNPITPMIQKKQQVDEEVAKKRADKELMLEARKMEEKRRKEEQAKAKEEKERKVREKAKKIEELKKLKAEAALKERQQRLAKREEEEAERKRQAEIKLQKKAEMEEAKRIQDEKRRVEEEAAKARADEERKRVLAEKKRLQEDETIKARAEEERKRVLAEKKRLQEDEAAKRKERETVAAASKTKKVPPKQPAPSLDATFTVDSPPAKPTRVFETYGIEDVKTDDETDDESNPKNPLPSWASNMTYIRERWLASYENPKAKREVFRKQPNPTVEIAFRGVKYHAVQRHDETVNWDRAPTWDMTAVFDSD